MQLNSLKWRRFVPYEWRVDRAKKEHAAANDPKTEIAHLMLKTNFPTCVQSAAAKLGRLSLVERLARP